MLQVVSSGGLISSPAAHGSPEVPDPARKASKPLATFPPAASVADVITLLSCVMSPTVAESL